MRSIVVLCFFALVAAAAAAAVADPGTLIKIDRPVDTAPDAFLFVTPQPEDTDDVPTAACVHNTCVSICANVLVNSGFRCARAWCENGVCRCHLHNSC
jgi:hypothetical protein